ncbi:hypothetical protein SKAU_G00083340 [Synaphobranchus kaupii]|uniref:Uncharacterized protein n=1 Tax=Synaphobranchus kaupii TaxID=118154 RepID=A0A9Q1FV90_SYNKA|nr:hypothetical protein SKAU_G00083340 [Synaphobranchus kaupii]
MRCDTEYSACAETPIAAPKRAPASAHGTSPPPHTEQLPSSWEVRCGGAAVISGWGSDTAASSIAPLQSAPSSQAHGTVLRMEPPFLSLRF